MAENNDVVSGTPDGGFAAVSDDSAAPEEQTVSSSDIEDIYDKLCAGDGRAPAAPSLSFHELSNRETEDRIRAACVRKTGDGQYYDILDFRHDPVTAALRALRRGVPIYVDTKATKELILEEVAQISGEALNSLPEIVCVTEAKEAALLSSKRNLSLAAAGFLLRKNDLSGAVLIIGKDDEALLGVCRLAERGIRPALIIAFPCGSGNQNKSKSYLRELSTAVASISTKSPKGGREAAAVCFAEIVAVRQNEPERR